MTTTIRLLSLKPRQDRGDYVSRVYPRCSNISLANTTRTSTGNYTLNKTAGYIANLVNEAIYGRRERAQTFQIDTPTNAITQSAQQQMAADALFDRALEWLEQHDTIPVFYTARVAGQDALLTAGTTIHVTTTTIVDGEAVYVIDDDFNITEARNYLNDAGMLEAELDLAAIERGIITDTKVLADTVMRVQRSGMGGGGVTVVGGTGGISYEAGPDIALTDTTIQRAGNRVLLFHGSGALLGDYAADSGGLNSALAAAASRDVVEIPAITITGDVSVPEGVILRGIGWNSIIIGAVTLGDDSGLEHLHIYQTVDSDDDVIGVIGPASGTAIMRDVQISLTQAGAGKALGLLSNGGTLRAYGCEVWVQGAAGSAWAAAAATGGTIELNHGQVKAWRTG